MSYGREHRKRAAELGAVEASTLIATIPGLDRLLTSDQVRQIQMVLDAAVLNPVLDKEARQAGEAAIMGGQGQYVVVDERKQAAADKIRKSRIFISEGDKRIKLDFNKMLTADALVQRSNNPDEGNYLGTVKSILSDHGVWLRMHQPFDRSPDRSTMLNPKVWELWFSLGSTGEALSTKDALLDREELLKTTLIGHGFNRAILTGPVQTKLSQVHKALTARWQTGFDEHSRLFDRYNSAFPGVAQLSDWSGGAHLPKQTVWFLSSSLLTEGYGYMMANDVYKAQILFTMAAIDIQVNTQSLNEYVERSVRGAAKWVDRFQKLQTVTDIMETVMILTGVGLVKKGITTYGKKVFAVEVAKDWVDDQVKDGIRDKVIDEYFKRYHK